MARVAGVCARGLAPLDLLARVASLVRPHVPYVAAGWILVDPDTLLMNGVYAEHVPRELHLLLIECELTEDDFTKFYDLARTGVGAASLSAATNGELTRSTRWSRIYQPHGYGDELRAVFASGNAVWGHVCLTRATDDPWFGAGEVDLLARICPHVGNGIRTSLALAGAPDDGGEAGPGFVVLTDDGRVESVSPEARNWLGPVEDESLATTIVLHQVAQQVRALAEGCTGGPVAMARVRARSGDWVVVRGARIGSDAGPSGRTALVLERASRSDVAPLLLRQRKLTRREQEVTRLMLAGLPTSEIAGELFISPETLRGHVKAVFAKLDVSSRPELAALLSHQPVVHPDTTVS
ncbi:helix-turn-helix transcriptional regulator [Nocardioides sp. YIM 152315]|uniref:response regulator transcription factor n=1 Tax=Nocardioides sp. YIM 152315 TaxID=3031760 RepID=UPI0023D9F347|nr:helix-turn-helix transcriptional regulator [Nocardioides sp. YIM 152315]MDF1605798.1 helix-turn-helix transcriptional regulator [Nocardioides sp. YIM 152315]